MVTDQKFIYLLLSNHRSPIGIEQQRDVIKRVFNKMEGYILKETNYLVPNKINILIEESNLDIISLMRDMKSKYKDTKFIIFVTEYLSKSFFGYLLNTFDLKTKLAHTYLRIISKIPLVDLARINHNQDFLISFYSKIIKTLKYSFINTLLMPLRLFFDKDGLINLTELTRREYCLRQSRDLYDLCISNCKSVNNTYEKFFKCKIILIPTFIDINKAKLARKIKKQSYSSSLFFSGRLTKYRKEVLKNLYRLNATSASDLFLQYFKSIKELKENKNDKYLKRIPLYELYIKQEKNWPYSSPMRTLMSIEEGHIPVNIGNFNDHDINSCAIVFKEDMYYLAIYKYISNVDIENAFKNLDSYIMKFNLSQEPLLESTNLAISKL